jgi:hypothetical protein
MASNHVLPDWVLQLPEEKASKPEFWQPKETIASTGRISRPAKAYHDPQQTESAPKFALARSRLDYSYHHNPAFSRQELQDAILSRVVSAAADVPSQQGKPWIVFSAGAMGVGKGYVLSTLYKSGLFPMDGFLKIDPDKLKV